MGEHFSRIPAVLGVASLALLAVGCGPDFGAPVDVSGKVTVDDKPVQNVFVSLTYSGEGRPAEARSFGGTTNAQGEYQIDGVYPGKYSVSFAEQTPEPKEGDDIIAEETGVLAKVDPEEEQTADVSADNTTFNFDLKSSR